MADRKGSKAAFNNRIISWHFPTGEVCKVSNGGRPENCQAAFAQGATWALFCTAQLVLNALVDHFGALIKR